ncbi:MAG TPA: acyl-CoA dehydrogenase family protein [Acidimicrobiales bacterium]|jgi:hypothetical protein|nr:acyl-CoA dehydrogenase family protein [Acidimicrobiales bacterium]
MESPDLALFRRSVQQATSTARGAELDTRLTDLGWLDAAVEDRSAAVSVMFESQGASNTHSSALDQLLALTMELSLPVGQAAVLLPALRDTAAPGRMEAGRISVRGIGSDAVDRRELAVVPVSDGPDHRAVAVPLMQLEQRRISGLDAALGLREISGDIPAGAAEDLGPIDWAEVVGVGQLALGHELVGAARTMLDLARTHARNRLQSGRPIASFQAVRHRLAEGLVAVEAAAALLDAAWDEPTPEVAAMAKGMAGRSGRTMARHAQQVLAGIGFTTEHSLHLMVRRTLVLDQMLGASAVLTRVLGAQVLEYKVLPATFSL